MYMYTVSERDEIHFEGMWIARDHAQLKTNNRKL